MRLTGSWLAALATASVVAALLLFATPSQAVMDWPDLLARPHPQATKRIAYGADPLQYADLWLPEGKGPFPTVLMIHGGCWLSGIAEADIMDYAAGALRDRGIAVWNIDYRGVDRPGGGYPGTFADVAAASDALRDQAARYNLSLDRLVAFGHSAGGHLALWSAARANLPRTSPLQ
jgi:acetyl esterase/lipase